MKTIKIIVFILVTFSIETECQNNNSNSELSGYTTVNGAIKNFQKFYDQYNIIEIQVDDWTTSLRRQYFANIDSLGEFSLSFYVFNPQNVLFTYKNKWHNIFVYPNDTLEISLDGGNFPEGNQYQGKTAKLCSDYLKYRIYNRSVLANFVSKNNQLQNTLSPDDYKHWRDSIYYSQLKNAENYIQLNNFNDFLRTWIKNDIYLNSINDVLGCYFRQRELKNIDTAFINSIYLEDSTLRFNSSYCRLINKTSTLLARFGSKYSSLNNLNLRRIKVLNIEENKPNDKPRLSKEQFQIELFNDFVHLTDVINNNLFKQSVIAERYLSILEQQNVDVGLDSVLKRINDYRIKASVISKYNDYEFRQGNLNSLKIGNPGSLLLDKLIDKFKGYVLCIDFWGTWWPPCFSQMNLMKNIEKELKNEKIAFIYLCCKCQKDIWEKTIRDFEGEHIFLSSEEYVYLSKQFNIGTLPTYIIIDKKGKIVNDRAPYPIEKSLVNDLRKYLRN